VTDAKLRICFVAHDAYGAMAGGNGGHIGGVERQTSLMARWFASRGHEVSILTWNEGGAAEEIMDRVRVIKLCRRDAGIKGLRFFWPKWTSLVAAMKRADAEVYYQNCAEYVTGQVALWCRSHGRRFVYSAAADTHCMAKLPYLPTLRERTLYRYGLKAADHVIVQTTRQRDMMQENFGCDSVVLPMPCPGPDEDEYRDFERKRDDSPRILWIGRICPVKRPDRFLDLAEACPDLVFDLVGPAADTEYARDVCQRARTIANVTLHGAILRDRVPAFYRKARILCCTSDSEGFPNTFLEAWSYGVPIVSTFDPGGMIADKGLGIIAQEVHGLAEGIRRLCSSPDQWTKMSQKVRQYYLENYTVEAAMPQFERVFLTAVNGVEL
jgi:glycosyltransferase involved in cell wall biosynthesis